MTENLLVYVLLFIIVVQLITYLVSIQFLLNKMMSRNYAEYSASKDYLKTIKQTATSGQSQFNEHEEIPEELRALTL